MSDEVFLNFIALFVLTACVYLRILPRIIFPRFSGTDMHFHFYYVNLIRLNNNSLPDSEPRIVGGSNKCNYPYFYHYLLSFLPHKYLVFLDKFSGAIFDFIVSFVALLFLNKITDISFSQGCLFLASYIISPSITFCFIGPRAYSLTPRNFSQAIFNLALFSILAVNVFDFHEITAVVLASVFLAMVLLSSKFGLQVLIFLFLGALFIDNLMLSILYSVVIAVTISRGRFFQLIKGHIEHLEWYYKYNYEFVTGKSNFRKMFTYIIKLDFRNFFYEVVFYNQVTTSIFRHYAFFIATIAVALLIVSEKISFATSHQLLEILFINLSMLLPFIVTNFGKGRVFGESERYLEFIFPLQHLLLFILIFNNTQPNPWIVLVLCYNFIWFLYNIYQIYMQNRDEGFFLDNVLSHIKNKNTVLLCLSNNQTYYFLRNTQIKLLGFLANISINNEHKSFFDKLFWRYPYVNPSFLGDLVREYNVNLVLVKKFCGKSLLKIYENKMKEAKFTICYENKEYALYENRYEIHQKKCL